MDALKVWTCVVIGSMIILLGLGLVPWRTGLEIIMRLSEVIMKFEGIYRFKWNVGRECGQRKWDVLVGMGGGFGGQNDGFIHIYRNLFFKTMTVK